MSLDLTFTAVRKTTVGDFNITHNLGDMADRAGIYNVLWNPGIDMTAGDMIAPLKRAIADMEERPVFYRQFDATNGWGTYDDFLPWLKQVLQCCINNPDAEIEVSR